MAENRDFQENRILEEKLRESMPILEVPERLSARSVAEYLNDGKRKYKTPARVYVRAAVAAVMVFALGAGVFSVVSGRRKKEMYAPMELYDSSYTEEESNESATPDQDVYYSYAVGDMDGYVTEEGVEENKSESGGAVIWYAALEEGESYVFSTKVEWAEELKVAVKDHSTESEAVSGVCEVLLMENPEGNMDVKVTGISGGWAEVFVSKDGYNLFSACVTVGG